MKKLLIPICILIISGAAVGQKARSKEVKSKYLSLPSYDLSTSDPSTIKVEFAMAHATFGAEKLKDTKTICVPKNGGIKDAIEVTTYYYELSLTKPESYLVAKDGAGNIVYAEKTSKKGQGTAKFGYEKCAYWLSDNLKKDWSSKATAFKSAEKKKYQDEVFKKAIKKVKKNIYLSYIEQEFNVYYAKGKVYDYSALDGAFDKAMAAYKGIAKSGINQSGLDALKECITIWEKELETVDLEDKKARITKEIAKGLYENCARAYMYMCDFDNGLNTVRKFQEMWGNSQTNKTRTIHALMVKMEKLKIAAEKNQSLMGDITALHANAETWSKKSPEVAQLSSGDLGRLRMEQQMFVRAKREEVAGSREEEENEAIASGTLNPYQKYVNMTPPTGPSILMTMAPSAFSGFPELSTVPTEMCELDLKQLIIRMNKIASVPAEIAKLQNLEKLDLTGNQLKTLPAEIGQLKKLKTLLLGKNPIESLPKEIANCENLKTLNLKGVSLSAQALEDLARWLPDCKIKN